MYLALTSSALASYTGNMGSVEFENGVSMDHISKHDLRRISSLTSTELIDKAPEFVSTELSGNKATVYANGVRLSFKWYLDDTHIASGKQFEIPDDKKYTCIVSNAMGEIRIQEISALPTKKKEDAALKDKSVEVEVKVESQKVFEKEGYSRVDLEKIADAKGISGLREIADKHGIKGRSISELIEELLKV